jgi:hypothetical protein
VVEPEIEEWLRLPLASLLTLIQKRARRQRAEVKNLRAVLDNLLNQHGGRNLREKACNPKDVFAGLVRYYGIPPSVALYGYLAKHEPVNGCLSDSFNRLLQTLRSWFPLQ